MRLGLESVGLLRHECPLPAPALRGLRCWAPPPSFPPQTRALGARSGLLAPAAHPRTLCHLCVSVLSRFSRVPLRATLCTEAYRAPPSTGLSRQGHWSELPRPPPGVFPAERSNPRLSGLLAGRGPLPTSAAGQPVRSLCLVVDTPRLSDSATTVYAVFPDSAAGNLGGSPAPCNVHEAGKTYWPPHHSPLVSSATRGWWQAQQESCPWWGGWSLGSQLLWGGCPVSYL